MLTDSILAGSIRGLWHSRTHQLHTRRKELGVNHYQAIGFYRVVLVDVQPGLLPALKRNAWAGKLDQAINIVRLGAQASLDAFAHLLAPSFGTEAASLELVREALFGHCFIDIGCLGRSAAKDGGRQVAHELDLALGIA